MLEGTEQTWSNWQASNSDIKVLAEEHKLAEANGVLAKLKKSDIMTRTEYNFFPDAKILNQNDEQIVDCNVGCSHDASYLGEF